MDKSNFFEHYYNNAQMNAIIIMSSDGIILEVNHAFTNNFGYTSKDLEGKHFRELFTKPDKNRQIPEIELDNVLKTRQANDEVYIIYKNG